MYTSEYFADVLIEFSSNSFVMIEASIGVVEIGSLITFSLSFPSGVGSNIIFSVCFSIFGLGVI